MKNTFKTTISIFIISLTVVGIAVLLYFFHKIEHIVNVENHQINQRIYLNETDTTLGSIFIDINVDIPTEYKDYQVVKDIRTEIYAALFGNAYQFVNPDSIFDLFIEGLVTEFKESNAEFAQNISDESFMAFNNSFQLEGFSLLSDEKIYSYGVSHFYDFGGAHPIYSRYFYNFDLKTGELISEEDIFKTGFQPMLAQIMRSVFTDDFNERKKYDLEGIDISDYDILEIKPNGNFYLNDEALCYVFNPYDIAPFYLGETEIALPYNSIKHLMYDKNPIQHLYNK